MSFDNEYPNRKDKRKNYRDSRRFDKSCRQGGSCPYCERNRTIQTKKAKVKEKEISLRDIKSSKDVDYED